MKSILIVEDNEMNIEVIQNFLKEYKSSTALTGDDAIKLSKENSFSLILMDINLRRGLNGIETLKEIRKIAGYENTPVLAVTGFAMMGDREKLLAEGFNDYLPKPFTSDELKHIVKKYI
jgi:CheY-like chemotaxis protein